MGGVLDMMLAAILSQEAFPEGVPNSSDIEDRMAADVVTAVCREHDQRTPVDRLRTRRMLSVLLGGDSFCRLRYDPSQLATVILSADEAELFGRLTETRPVSWTQFAGGPDSFSVAARRVTEHNVSASLVYPEHGVESWEDVSRLSCCGLHGDWHGAALLAQCRVSRRGRDGYAGRAGRVVRRFRLSDERRGGQPDRDAGEP
jgi:hypothetical protein